MPTLTTNPALDSHVEPSKDTLLSTAAHFPVLSRSVDEMLARYREWSRAEAGQRRASLCAPSRDVMLTGSLIRRRD